jgi:hypothetical protein
LRAAAESTPYVYPSGRYREGDFGIGYPQSWTFPTNHLDFDRHATEVGQCAEVVYSVWAGSEPMSAARAEALSDIRRRNADVDVELVTAASFASYLPRDVPVPGGFASLSSVHQSDVIRCYLMRHLGGAYMDVKSLTGSWRGMLDEINSDESVWIIGPAESRAWNVSAAAGPLGRDQSRNYFKFVSPAAFACRPGSPFVLEWYDEVNRRLRYYEDLLVEAPAQHAYDTALPYPVAWNALHGAIFTPLQLKYLDHVRADPSVDLDLPGSYR